MLLRDNTIQQLGKTGQVASFQVMETLVFDFEKVLQRHGISIQTGSELEGACCSVLEVLGKHNNKAILDPMEDVRKVYTEVLGIWTFLKKIVRLQNHPNLDQFVPHLALLNKGTVIQNKCLRACQDATNKIFELLFALVLLDVSTEVQLDHPSLAKGDNPDILALIDGQRWGFACKTIYGQSGKAFYDNLKKGVEQIDDSPATIGCVVVNFRNLLSQETYWPILNDTAYSNGAEPIFAAYDQPEKVVAPKLWNDVALKAKQVVDEIGAENVLSLFEGKKALPAFMAFCQTVTGKDSAIGPIPTSIMTLAVHEFPHVLPHLSVFEKMNFALHERQHHDASEEAKA